MGRSPLPRGFQTSSRIRTEKVTSRLFDPEKGRVFGEAQAWMLDPDASNSFWGNFRNLPHSPASLLL
jgi:hypothetical protein